MKADELRAEIWRIREEVHQRIGPLREEAYKILSYSAKPHGLFRLFKRGKDEKSSKALVAQDQTLRKTDEGRIPSESNRELSIQDFAKEAVDRAKRCQVETQKIDTARPRDVLEMTRSAGHCLADVETLLLKCESNSVLTDILSDAMTIVITARDQILAADGHLKNLKHDIGSDERNRLLLILSSVGLVYVVFHPYFRLSWSLPLQYQAYWEVVFWSWFGALCLSLIAIAEDVMGDRFDPRRLDKYTFRIPVAPFFAAVLILFMSVVRFTINPDGTGGGGSFTVELVNPNMSLLIILSFLFGFFSKRALEVLDQAWRRLVPETRPEEENGAS